MSQACRQEVGEHQKATESCSSLDSSLKPSSSRDKDNLNPETCTICFNIYNESLCRPRVFPCGHTFCSMCISDIINSDYLACPNCRSTYTATDVTEFPVNYNLETLLKKLIDDQLVLSTTDEKSAIAVTDGARPRQHASRGISMKLNSLVEEQRSSVCSSISVYEKAQYQLDEYKAELDVWKTCHQKLLDKLNSLVEQSKAALALVEQDEATLQDMKEEGKEGKKEMETIVNCLDVVSNAQEAAMTIDNADRCIMEAEEWIQKCQELFPYENKAYTSFKKLKESIGDVMKLMAELKFKVAP